METKDLAKLLVCIRTVLNGEFNHSIVASNVCVSPLCSQPITHGFLSAQGTWCLF